MRLALRQARLRASLTQAELARRAGLSRAAYTKIEKGYRHPSLRAVAGWREAFLFVPLIGVPIMILQVILGNKKNQDRVYGWIK
ncbi:MAG: helix-turn-helix transcriptional regulator [Clostridia bacterium]|nr:helix-turn-helix transcriptional regulator [Clostridia bacterium]